jgi:hypothetical protein
MALTTTTLVNAVAIAASTPVAETSATATALQAGTISFVVHGKIKGDGQMNPSSCVRVWFKCLPYDSTDGVAKQAVGGAYMIDLSWNSRPGQYSVTSSLAFPCVGGYLHWWYEVPSLPFGATITITLVECPSTLVNP